MKTFTWITYFLIGVNIFLIGMSWGMSIGFNRAVEADKKFDCEMEYSYKPYEEIPGKCLKYFDLK